MGVRILLADDHTLMRQGLRALLLSQPGVEVVGEAGDGRTTVQLADELHPDVVIMDISMPDLNGIEATRQVVSQSGQTRVVALSMHSDRRFVTQVLRAGASGYLLKDCAFEELARAIRAVLAGQTYLSPGIAGPVVEDYLRQLSGADAKAASDLSSREREILQLLAEGHASKEIATQLNLSVKTVDHHRRRVMDKIGARGLADLTKYAIREGLTSPEA